MVTKVSEELFFPIFKVDYDECGCGGVTGRRNRYNRS
jgi:hypothetical protein